MLYGYITYSTVTMSLEHLPTPQAAPKPISLKEVLARDKERERQKVEKNTITEITLLESNLAMDFFNELPRPGVEIIQTFESCKLTAYPDPRTKGKPYTIGWGSTRKLDGSPFVPGEKITKAQADILFVQQLKKEFLPSPEKNIPYWKEMNEHMQGALLSFTYNFGQYFFGHKNFTTITSVLKNKQWRQVPKALYLYRNPGSNVEEGLKRRRVREGEEWMKGLRQKGLA